MTMHPSPHFDDTRRSGPAFSISIPVRLMGLVLAALCAIALLSLASWSVDDPSFSYATDKPVENWLGFTGAAIADIAFQLLGLAALVFVVPPLVWSLSMIRRTVPSYLGLRLTGWLLATLCATALFSCISVPQSWPLPLGLGGYVGTLFTGAFTAVMGAAPQGWGAVICAMVFAIPTLGLLWLSARAGPAFEDQLPVPATQRKSKKTSPKAQPLPEDEPDEADSGGIFDLVLGYLA